MPRVNSGSSSSYAAVPVDKMFLAWKTFMVTQAGWTVIASGDGLSGYSTSGDILTSAAAVAGGLGNTKSWFILKEPSPGFNGLQRQFLIYRASEASPVSRNVMYSAQGFDLTNGHNSASISPTNPPVAYDEILLGSGNYAPSSTYNANITAASTGNTWLPSANITPYHVYNFFASTTAPFNFYFLITTVTNASQYDTSGYMNMFFAMDELAEYQYNHGDPTVLYFCSPISTNNGVSLANLNNMANDTASFLGAWENKTTFISKSDSATKTTSGYQFAPMAILFPSAAYTAFATTTGSGTQYMACESPFSKKDILHPVLYGGAQNQYLFGKSSFLYNTVNVKPFAHLYSVNSTYDSLSILASTNVTTYSTPSTLVIPWNGSVPTF